MSKINNSGLSQYKLEPFEQQKLRIAGVEGVKLLIVVSVLRRYFLCILCRWLLCGRVHDAFRESRLLKMNAINKEL